MDDSFLSLICNVYKLNIKEFYFLRSLQARSITEYIATQKEKVSSDVWSEIKHWHELHKKWGSKNVLYPGHEKYPLKFYDIESPPVYLSYKGSLEILEQNLISIVGSRVPQFRFSEWMEQQLGQFLSKTSVGVVSGGAYGVDQKASRLALAHNRSTILFLPSGFENIYPKNIGSIINDSRTLSLTEYLPNQVMMKHHFVVRNRLVAGLSIFLLVVQAAQKSGSMITARYAMDFGREIATLPDFPGNAESSGNLNMIRDGAQIVQTSEDLLTMYQRLCFGVVAPSPNSQS